MILTAIPLGLSELLRPGELDAITLSWGAVRIPVIPRNLHEPALREPGIIHARGAPTDWCEGQRLMVDLTSQGEQFSFQVATADDDTDDLDLAWTADGFYRRLQDWIAESRFGWGGLRGGHRHPPALALRAGAGVHPTSPAARSKQRGTV